MAQPPIYLTLLRRGDTNIIDLAEVGSLIPRSETRVDDAFLQEVIAEITSLATLGAGWEESGAVVRDLQRIGGVIFSHLLTEPARRRLRMAEPCELYLRLDEQLLQVPWELGYDGEQFLATKFRMGRQVITSSPLPAPVTAHRGLGPLRVLLIADPTETLPQASKEVERLCELLAEIRGVEVTLLGGSVVRKVPLLAALQTHDIVHFAGHSRYDAQTPSRSGWVLHEGLLTAGELSKLGRPPQLVFSNSCEAGTTATWEGGFRCEGQAFGLGSAFLLAGVQSYVGTLWMVADEESIIFAMAFYRGVTMGQSVGEALLQARHVLLAQRGKERLTWASYALYGDPAFSLLPTTNDQPRPVVTPPPRPAGGRQRKLAAILSADVQGYSRLMGEDEEATIRTLTAYQGVMATLIAHHQGRVVDTPGDNLLAEFASAVDAVQCAVKIQQELKFRNTALSPDRRMEFRVGVNVGDVIVEGGKLYGEGINIAARLESLAEGGGICISGTVYDQIENKLALAYEYLGEQPVKNITKPVRVYRVRIEPRATTSQGEDTRASTSSTRMDSEGSDPITPSLLKGAQRHWEGTIRHTWGLVTGMMVIMAAVVAVRYLAPLFLSTQDSTLRTEEAPVLPLPLKPSIAVLPFTNMSGDVEQEYFSDGMTDTLITDLSKLSGLFVIARNSTFAYKGKVIKPQQVSQELGVRYVVEGSVQKADTRVRIIAQLIDATTGHHLWAERYDRELKEIFTLQDELTQKIILALKINLTTEEQKRFRRAPTKKLDAYDALLRGEVHFWTFTKEANTKAQLMFEKAVELDPQYAAAYAALSMAQLMDWVWWAPFRFSLDQIFANAQKAVEIDDSLALAHIVLANVNMWKKSSDHAIAEAERAVALDPNFANGYHTLAMILNSVGRWEEAIAAVEKGLKLNPTPPAQYLATLGESYVLAGRHKEAIATSKKALAHNPHLLDVLILLAMSYSESGQEEAARTTVAELLKRAPAFSLEVARLKAPYKDPVIMERRLTLLHKAGMKWYWPTENVKALGYVWSGLEQMGRSTPTKEATEKARQMFEHAIERDPQYAGAHAFLGRTYLMEWVSGWSDDSQDLARALELGQKAVTLDSALPWMHRQSSMAYLWNKQHAQALAEGERAIALDPTDAESYATLAEILNYAGQPEKALSMAEQALTLAPQNPTFAFGEQAFAYELLERYEDAMLLYKKVTAAIPDEFGPHLGLAVVYSELGQDKEARAEVKEMLRLLPHFSLALMKERYPFKDQAPLQRELNALRKAGLK